MSTRAPNRILLIDLGASMGGVEAYLDGLAEILVAENEVFALCVLQELATKLQRHGVRVFSVPVFARLRALRFVTALFALVYVVVRFRIQTIQINGFLESILLLPARLLGCSAVYTKHGPLEVDLYRWYRQPFKYAPRLLSRYGAHLATHLVCVSETVGAIYKPLFRKERVSVIPNWVKSIPESSNRPNQPRVPLQIVFVGRLEQYKGVQLLLEAARDLKGCALTIVGMGSYSKSLELLAQGIDCEFAGFHRDPAPYYRKADIFVMPSFGPEGLPMVTLEAMAYGIPCVLSDLPVHCEVTDNGRAALLFRCGDAHDLKQKLAHLMDDKDLRDSLAEQARCMVNERYHYNSARKAYLTLFAGVRPISRNGRSVAPIRSHSDAHF